MCRKKNTFRNETGTRTNISVIPKHHCHINDGDMVASLLFAISLPPVSSKVTKCVQLETGLVSSCQPPATTKWQMLTFASDRLPDTWRILSKARQSCFGTQHLIPVLWWPSVWPLVELRCKWHCLFYRVLVGRRETEERSDQSDIW